MDTVKVNVPNCMTYHSLYFVPRDSKFGMKLSRSVLHCFNSDIKYCYIQRTVEIPTEHSSVFMMKLVGRTAK
jgi:hypothetical protein